MSSSQAAIPPAPPTPSKRRVKKSPTAYKNDARYGYLRGNNWTGAEVLEVNGLQKTKERLRGSLSPEAIDAWQRGDVDGFNGLLVGPLQPLPHVSPMWSPG